MAFNFLDLLLPREMKFFDYLSQFSDHILASCNTFHDLVVRIETLSEDELHKRLYIIKDHEAKGDRIEETIIKELSRCFITPLDREDIHTLADCLDKPLNELKDLASKIEIYQIRKMPVRVCEFSEILVSAAKLQQELIHDLSTKKSVRRKVDHLHKLENQADELFNVGMAELFSQMENGITVDMVKFKEVYELLESTVDRLDEIGKLVRGIKIKRG